MLAVQSRDAIREAEQGEANIEALEEQLEEARRQEAAAKAVLDAQRTAGRDGEVLSGRELKEIRQSVLSPGSARGGRGGGGLLGGLFGGAAKAAVDDVEEEVRRPRRQHGCVCVLRLLLLSYLPPVCGVTRA